MIKIFLANPLAQANFKSSHGRARAFVPVMIENRRKGDRIGRICHRAWKSGRGWMTKMPSAPQFSMLEDFDFSIFDMA